VAAAGVKAAGDSCHYSAVPAKMKSNVMFGARGAETHTGVIDP